MPEAQDASGEWGVLVCYTKQGMDVHFKSLLSDFQSLNIPKSEYAIFGSGPIVVRGIREASHDLDVIVTQKIWDDYKGKEGWVVKPCGEDFYNEWEGHNIELWYKWAPGDWNIADLIKESDEIDGFNFVRLETVLKWKKELAREKDIRDAQLIEKFLSES